MKKLKYFVCPHCGNLTLTTGDASITCCGRSLEPMTAKKAEESEKFHVEVIENDWFLTTDHPMEKENYISFVAFATGDKVQLYKQYPEWDLQLRIPNVDTVPYSGTAPQRDFSINIFKTKQLESMYFA